MNAKGECLVYVV